ncbi:hypothetical protein KC963_03885, partial [Candidatus Saccharibacteria bacterium]|nr:hypothetical protein [Candidatus Saccharibacteria bacterium]
ADQALADERSWHRAAVSTLIAHGITEAPLADRFVDGEDVTTKLAIREGHYGQALLHLMLDGLTETPEYIGESWPPGPYTVRAGAASLIPKDSGLLFNDIYEPTTPPEPMSDVQRAFVTTLLHEAIDISGVEVIMETRLAWQTNHTVS